MALISMTAQPRSDVAALHPHDSSQRCLWLDCDPGHDDMMAIILAAHSSSCCLLGISTVHGNQTVEKVTDNALRVLHLCGRDDVDVVSGQALPLMRESRICDEIHGDSGLDGPTWDCGANPKKALAGVAANVMWDVIERAYRMQGQRVLLVCTASLTNAALLITLYPQTIEMLEIVIMGGCLGVGNTGPVMEFNIQCDPEAAHIVFESGVPLTMIPLEVTHTVLVTPPILSRILTPHPSKFREIVAELLMFFAKSYREQFLFDHPPLHDPCAVAYALRPQLFTTEFLRVDIERKSELSSGQTVCDIWKQSGKAPNVTVAKSLDLEEFWNLMIYAIDDADKVSPVNCQ